MKLYLVELELSKYYVVARSHQSAVALIKKNHRSMGELIAVSLISSEVLVAK